MPVADVECECVVLFLRRSGQVFFHNNGKSFAIAQAAVQRSKVLREFAGAGTAVCNEVVVVAMGILASDFEAWLSVVSDTSPRQRQLKSMTAPELRTLLEVLLFSVHCLACRLRWLDK